MGFLQAGRREHCFQVRLEELIPGDHVCRGDRCICRPAAGHGGLGLRARRGSRDPVIEMLDRRNQGGPNLLGNRGLMDLVSQVNGKAPVWMAMDKQFTFLAVKQMLPGAETLPGFEGLAGRLQSSLLRFDLNTGMRGQAAVRCGSSGDATLVSTLLQAAVSYQAWKLKDENPDLSRVLNDTKLNRNNETVELSLEIRDTDFATLLAKNSFALKF
jgi:hypothetical protein